MPEPNQDRNEPQSTSWLAYRRQKRAVKRELRAERRGRGNKGGDVLYDASQAAEASNFSGGGFFSSKPTDRK
jgi:hypothetical protein